jgi:hypothetical protein
MTNNPFHVGPLAQRRWIAAALAAMPRHNAAALAAPFAEIIGADAASALHHANDALADALWPFAAPATPELLAREMGIEPSAIGTGEIPLDPLPLAIARRQVAAALAAPFPARDAIGHRVVW